MKVGDRVYCIKNRTDYSEEINDFEFVHKINKEYKIVSIIDNLVFLTSENANFDYFYYYVVSTFNVSNIEFYIFEDYFLTHKQYRKLKMKKLCQR